MAAHHKFQQSGPFRALLDEFVVERGAAEEMVLVHADCGEAVCLIEADDTMSVLVETVIQHDCESDDGSG